MPTSIVPAEWMPHAKLKGIVVHWTGGPHRATALDREHYHLVIEGDGTLVRGRPSIDLNGLPRVRKGYAAHTRNCNSGWIGVSLACMAGAVEDPFDAGSAPLTRSQWETLPRVLADLCRRYGIAVTPRTILSHAEVQGTLGLAQAGKWDISRLPFDPAVTGARACGDLFRSGTAALLAAPGADAAEQAEELPQSHIDGTSSPPSPGGGGSPAKPAGRGETDLASSQTFSRRYPPITPPRTSGPTLPLQGRVGVSASEPLPPLLVATKRRLRDLGYFTVGAIDAEIGPRTIAALSQFQAVAGLPVTGRLDEATMAAIWAEAAPAAPISAARAGIEASELAASGNPVVAAARKAKLASLIGVALGIVGTVWSAVQAHFGDAWSGLAPLRQVVAAPDWLWGVLACGVALFLYRQGRAVETAEVEAVRTGRQP